ncbi:MAG: flagellum-specific ATP synthase FliI [Spirochaetes bacterium]|nr:MAG: flagellum-specific ATP synthase FliI [Spirochaetota bacterium]
MGIFDKYSSQLDRIDPIKYTGTVARVIGLLIESKGPHAVVGELCQILVPKGRGVVWAEVVGLKGSTVQLMTYDEMEGIEVGCLVIAMGEQLSVPVSEKLLGRVLDSMGKPIDGKGDIGSADLYSIFGSPPHVLRRQRITEKMTTGIRAIDGLITVGKGQRVGIFSGSGVGKSTLLGMIARNTSAQVNVIALIGERGREVREFIENELGEEGLKRSVIIVASSNKPPISRIRGAYIATAVAEYFRDRGLDVMLLFDSVTRFARAQREVGLAVGEPPATRGYTPSVFAQLPKLLERSGAAEKGTITGFYTILVEGDDMDEPIADNVRGILDGHIVLERKLAERNHYPAVDVLKSISRLAVAVTGDKTKKAAGFIKRMLAVYAEAEDLINVGAYAKGSNEEIDMAIEVLPAINKFLIQGIKEKSTMGDALKRIGEIAGIEIPEEEIGSEALSVSA